MFARSPHPARVRMVFGDVEHREFDADVAFDTDRLGRRDMGGAEKLKLIRALADPQLGLAGFVGTGAKRSDPNLDALERRPRGSLRHLDGELVIGLCRDHHAELRCERFACATYKSHGVFGDGLLDGSPDVERSPVQRLRFRPRRFAEVASRYHRSARVADLDTTTSQ